MTISCGSCFLLDMCDPATCRCRCHTGAPGSALTPKECDMEIELLRLVADFRQADEADRQAGSAWNDATKATERVRSLALEALVFAVPCPTCNAGHAGCRGKVAHTDPLWSLDHTLPLHQSRIDAVNQTAARADGGPKVIVRDFIQF